MSQCGQNKTELDLAEGLSGRLFFWGGGEGGRGEGGSCNGLEETLFHHGVNQNIGGFFLRCLRYLVQKRVSDSINPFKGYLGTYLGT